MASVEQRSPGSSREDVAKATEELDKLENVCAQVRREVEKMATKVDAVLARSV